MAWASIKLCKKSQTLNAYGDIVETLTKREVLVEEKSVGFSEVYQAMAVGFKPEVRFVLQNFADYQGEEIVEYKPFLSADTAIMRVLRTYRAGDTLELTCYAGNDNPKVVTTNAGT